MPTRSQPTAISAERIDRAIVVLRRQRVLMDIELAELYDVQTRVLIQAVKRNLSRFPQDFMFQLTKAEWASLTSQSVTSKAGRGGRRYAPYAFTEQGVAMLSSVLNSERAIAVNIEIMRAFRQESRNAHCNGFPSHSGRVLQSMLKDSPHVLCRMTVEEAVHTNSIAAASECVELSVKVDRIPEEGFVQILVPNGSDESFHERVRHRGVWHRFDLLDLQDL